MKADINSDPQDGMKSIRNTKYVSRCQKLIPPLYPFNIHIWFKANKYWIVGFTMYVAVVYVTISRLCPEQ